MSTRRQRKQQKEEKSTIKLSHPDRSGPDPSQETLLDIAAKRGASLQKAADARQAEIDASRKKDDEDEILIGRLGDSILWSMSLAMLHFTLDVLVQHQYAQEINWPTVFSRAAQAFPVIFLLFYTFHPHPSPSGLLPQLPTKYQPLLHQLFFFIGSVAAGSYLIYITNEHGYYATMKRAPPVGCLWVWSVIELDLLWAIASLIGCAVYWRWNNYAFL